MKQLAAFKDLTKYELALWLTSVVVILFSYLIPQEKDYLALIASLIGVTALIFVAKGYVLGQVLTVVFAVFYGLISFLFKYYGEMITYLFMTAPIAIFSVISWMRHPYEGTKEVEVSHVTKRQVIVMIGLAIIITGLFYMILKLLGNANLLFSTLSITTSFVACYLSFLRSPYYAIAYAFNDIVLIVLWLLATLEDTAFLPMIFCFVMFLVNDIYGFYNWRRMQKRQGAL